MPAYGIVGAQWGDEGKGKVVDYLAEKADMVVRFSGGSNAGHTVINDQGKFALHLVPSGIFWPHADAVIGPGDTVVLPEFHPVIFNHEAELGVVIGKEAHNLSESDALSYVFGYTTAVDVSARAPEEGEASLSG